MSKKQTRQKKTQL